MIFLIYRPLINTKYHLKYLFSISLNKSCFNYFFLFLLNLILKCTTHAKTLNIFFCSSIFFLFDHCKYKLEID